MTCTMLSSHERQGRQAGVSLLFALLALVSLSLAAVALVRSVDTGALVMGNLGFKQDATASADIIAQKAILSLTDGTLTNLNADDGAHGYYATAHESIDVTGQKTSDESRELINWDLNSCANATNASSATCLVRPSDEIEHNSNKMRYVIFRLCSVKDSPDAAGNACARPKAVTSSSSSEGSGTSTLATHTRGEIKYGQGKRFGTPASTGTGAYQGVYYRIVVRVIGARNTTSFVETIVHL